jgi:hypothetical protein
MDGWREGGRGGLKRLKDEWEEEEKKGEQMVGKGGWEMGGWMKGRVGMVAGRKGKWFEG